MKGLHKFRIKGCIGLLLIGMLTVSSFGNRVVYAKDQAADKEVTTDASDGLQLDEETATQETEINSTDILVKEPLQETEHIETDTENEEIAPIEVKTIEVAVWRGSGEDETITLNVGEPLLQQLGDAPEVLTSGSGVTTLCEGWMLNGALINSSMLVEDGMAGKRITVKPHRHTWTAYEEKAPSCEETGWTGGEYCSYERCRIENPDKPRQQVTATGHDFSGAWEKEEKGHFRSCQNGCGKKTELAAHNLQVNADHSQTCTECAYEAVAAHDHDDSTLQKADASPATCTAPALKEHYECKECGKYFEAADGQKELTLAELMAAPALGHKYGEWKDAANGKQERVCAACGAKEERNKPAATPGGNNGNQNAGNTGNTGNTAPSSSHNSSGQSSTSTPVSVATTGAPQTADTSNVLLWAVIMLLSGCGLVFCAIKVGKNR